jgi:hypothetical protein
MEWLFCFWAKGKTTFGQWRSNLNFSSVSLMLLFSLTEKGLLRYTIQLI